ncbi:MAG: Unknown protein [uncultured Sulfurovum sp.]|uniref:Uncharacterized protein n=1 Tax=uncultured Sulfurovum sp. TaxID=269237 RepID=A0A6S6T9Z7_9BACT|nr:MAG: Unknown protein [uncultured Sulfurovum sp.]
MKKIFSLLLFVSLLQAATPQANVTAVFSKKVKESYRFGVTLKSDETGCDQYADWWEILNEEGHLLYRRILIHSHPDTQPFTRWGSSFEVKEDQTLYIRAHMNKLGYEGDVFKGSIIQGFKKAKEIPDFNQSIETQTPLPQGCLY